MCNKEIVGLRWLANGEPDPHPDLINKPREQLKLAEYSDDELANLLFLNLPIDKNKDLQLMLTGNQSSIGMLTANKERLRWLSRRVMVLEQRLEEIQEELDIQHHSTMASNLSLENCKDH